MAELADSTFARQAPFAKQTGRRGVRPPRPYLKKQNDVRKHPDDLADHACILMRFRPDYRFATGRFLGRWKSAAGSVVRDSGLANDGGLVRDWLS